MGEAGITAVKFESERFLVEKGKVIARPIGPYLTDRPL
jgi:hypothetical protein